MSDEILAAVDRSSTYKAYYIQHSVPRFNNPTGVFDNDQYIYKVYVKCSDTSLNQNYWGVQGVWPAMQIGTSMCWCSTSAPVVGFEKCVMEFAYPWGNSCHGGSYGGCYYNAPNGYLRIPGSGGMGTVADGGASAYGGDSGRFGMVCVSWN